MKIIQYESVKWAVRRFNLPLIRYQYLKIYKSPKDYLWLPNIRYYGSHAECLDVIKFRKAIKESRKPKKPIRKYKVKL